MVEERSMIASELSRTQGLMQCGETPTGHAIGVCAFLEQVLDPPRNRASRPCEPAWSSSCRPRAPLSAKTLEHP